MRISLTVIAGPHQGREFSFAQHDTFLIGRSRHAHFQLLAKDRYFSRIHFMLEVNPPHCRLIDLGSHNGTFVNGAKVFMADLKDGDQIRAGHTTLRLTLVRDDKEDDSEPFSSEEVPFSLPGTSGLPAWLPPDLGDYHFERELGRGNMGFTFLARRQRDGALFAVKIIRPQGEGTLAQAHHFLQQAKSLGSLRHAHIVRLHELGEKKGLLYFVFDYVPGTDAARIMQEKKPPSVGRVLIWADQALEALEYAHGKKIIHRDLKPANFLFQQDEGQEKVYLADFGLAHLYQKSQLSGLTMIQPGNAAFFPPEYITHYHDANVAGDQYSLAAILYFLLTAQSPLNFPEELHGQFSVLLEQKAQPIKTHRPDLPGKLAAAIDKALSRDPRNRYPNVSAFRQALTMA
jgi:serine/threonine protein kinase